MTWLEGPAPQTGAAVQVFDVGFLRHAMIVQEDSRDAVSASYAESPFAAGPPRTIRLCRFQGGQAIGEPWHAAIGGQ